MEDNLEPLILWYEEGTFRPNVDALSNWPELGRELGKCSNDGWVNAVSVENLMIEVKLADGRIVESRTAHAID